MQKKDEKAAKADKRGKKKAKENFKEKENPLTYKSLLPTLSGEEKERLARFFEDFSIHCLINKKDKRKLLEDFEVALSYYIESGFSLSRALELIDPKNLGGFYARPAVLWFPLDDAAKIYPLSMEHGRMSVFRLSVYLKEDIRPELLQMALNFTIKRFPTLATTLKRGFFWHYLDTAKRRFEVREEWDIPCSPLKVSKSGSGAFRVLYFKNRISAEFFHVLTDGTGATAFLKALTAEYLRLKGEDVNLEGEDFNINEIPATREFENAFKKVPKSDSASGFVDKPALQMNGRLTETKPCRIIHFKMEADSLKAAAKSYGATVTAYILALMFMGARAATDELTGDISFQVPVNMRKFYPFKTLRNFSMYCGVRIPIASITGISDILPEISSQLAQKASKEAMSEMLTATGNTVNMLKYIPLVIKQPVAKLIYGFLGDNIFTSTISNMGVISFPPSVARHIEGMDFVMGTSVLNRVSCSMITVNNTATFSVSKNTADPSFEEKLYELLTRDGVKTTLEGSQLYEY